MPLWFRILRLWLPVAVAARLPAMCAWSLTVVPTSTGIEAPVTPPPVCSVEVLVGASTVRISPPQVLVAA